jgi:cephalosporin hydroxylase
MPFDKSLNRPWGPSNSPMTAVNQFLINNNEFVIDSNIHNKLLITVAPNGYLKKIK